MMKKWLKSHNENLMVDAKDIAKDIIGVQKMQPPIGVVFKMNVQYNWEPFTICEDQSECDKYNGSKVAIIVHRNDISEWIQTQSAHLWNFSDGYDTFIVDESLFSSLALKFA